MLSLPTDHRHSGTNVYRTVDDAMNAHVDRSEVATIAVARNTEHYSLEKTALPILRVKYEQGMGKASAVGSRAGHYHNI